MKLYVQLLSIWMLAASGISLLELSGRSRQLTISELQEVVGGAGPGCIAVIATTCIKRAGIPLPPCALSDCTPAVGCDDDDGDHGADTGDIFKCIPFEVGHTGCMTDQTLCYERWNCHPDDCQQVGQNYFCYDNEHAPENDTYADDDTADGDPCPS